MTDNEIAKTLECCTSSNFEECWKCPLHNDFYPNSCHYERDKNALDLINRRKAEREMIRRDYECLVTQVKDAYAQIVVLNRKLNTAKSEAIKEFAMNLKCGVPQETGVIRCADVDNLVKEMAGEDDG